MNKLGSYFLALVLATLAGSASAATINVSGSSTFDSRPAGILGSWTHTYSTGSPDVVIQEIVIRLNSNLFFDLTSAAPGHLAWQGFSTNNDGGTGFVSFSAATDGSMSVKLTFGNFNVGESYLHFGDVDEWVNVPSCQGQSGFGLAICLALAGLANTDGSLVTGSEFEGSTIEVLLGGVNVPATTVYGNFTRTDQFVAVAEWRASIEVDDGNGTNDNVPEPSTWLLGACGLGALAAQRRAARR